MWKFNVEKLEWVDNWNQRTAILQSLLISFIIYTKKMIAEKVKLTFVATRERQSPSISQRSSSVGSDMNLSATLHAFSF